jgi:elongation factor Ts
MEITAQQVKELREKTGAGMMDCKKALAETQGDIEKAVHLLREKGIAKAASKEGRTTSEGTIASNIANSDKLGVLVEINCETDFVARTDKFKQFAADIATHIVTKAPKDIDDLNAQIMPNHENKSVSDYVKGFIGSLGENTQIRRFVRMETPGYLTTYIHPGDKLGVLVELEASNGVSSKPLFKQFARDIAMQIAATSPQAVRREELNQELLASERDIFRKQVLNEGKPEKIVDKIVDGKMEKYFTEIVLMEQLFVKDNDKTIGDLLKETVAGLGEAVAIKRFARFRLGE